MKIGEIIRHKQPDVYRKLMEIKEIKKNTKPREVKINSQEVEYLMRHDGYKRIHGAIKQVKR